MAVIHLSSEGFDKAIAQGLAMVVRPLPDAGAGD